MATFIESIEIHPAAELFPEMNRNELRALTEDVRKHGLQEPLEFFEGKLLDGRNRLRACLVTIADVNKIPRKNLPPNTDPYAHAWSKNCERLNYDLRLRNRIHIKVKKASGEFERQRSETAKAANAARSATASKRPRDDKGRLAKGPVEPHGEAPLGKGRNPSNKTAAKVAASIGVSRATVERAQRAEREAAGQAPLRTPSERRYSQRKVLPGVPANVDDLTAYLRARLTSAERRKLAAGIWTPEDEAMDAEVATPTGNGD